MANRLQQFRHSRLHSLAFPAITRVLLLFPLALAAAEDATIRPLFDVSRGSGFPDAREVFEETRKLILEEYYTDTLTEASLYHAAIEGMLRHISPPDNRELGQIFPPAAYAEVKTKLEGAEVAIGIKSSFDAAEGSLTIAEIQEGSPADGVLVPRDRILRIDGKRLKGLPVNEVDELLKGPEESEVTLTVVRDIRVFDITLKRKRFSLPLFELSRLDEGLLYLRPNGFSLGTTDAIAPLLRDAHSDGFDKLVLDLRNNTGGVFSEALSLSKLFVQNQGITLRTYDRKNGLTNYGSDNTAPLPFRLAVLINTRTASASEVVVGALRDQRQAFVVGTKTYGKGVFEKTFTLKNDYRIKFITGAMYTPTGKAWQGGGLVPDYLVDESVERVTALQKIPIEERLDSDVAFITARKLLLLAR